MPYPPRAPPAPQAPPPRNRTRHPRNTNHCPQLPRVRFSPPRRTDPEPSSSVLRPYPLLTSNVFDPTYIKESRCVKDSPGAFSAVATIQAPNPTQPKTHARPRDGRLLPSSDPLGYGTVEYEPVLQVYTHPEAHIYTLARSVAGFYHTRMRCKSMFLLRNMNRTF